MIKWKIGAILNIIIGLFFSFFCFANLFSSLSLFFLLIFILLAIYLNYKYLKNGKNRILIGIFSFLFCGIIGGFLMLIPNKNNFEEETEKTYEIKIKEIKK